MKKYFMLPVILSLFDGGGAGGAASAGATGDGSAAPGVEQAESNQGDTKGGRASTRRGNNTGEDLSDVVYGKQPPEAVQQQNAAQKQEGNTVQSHAAGEAKSKEELHAEFLELVNGKYKDAYTAETQRIIDRRFKTAKETEQALNAQRGVIESLMTRYGIADGDIDKLTEAVNADDELLRDAAEAHGMDVPQFREFQKMKRENEALKQAEAARLGKERADRQIAAWEEEVAALRGTPEAPGDYPDINLSEEVKNPVFLSMLRAHVPLRDAYEQVHRDEIRQKIAAQAAADAEKRISDSIRANGMRPKENGSSSRSSFQSKTDPSNWTNADMDEVAKRVRRGEKVYL